MLYFPCIEDKAGRVVKKVTTVAMPFSEALKYLVHTYPHLVDEGRAVPQCEDHPGLVR